MSFETCFSEPFFWGLVVSGSVGAKVSPPEKSRGSRAKYRVLNW